MIKKTEAKVAGDPNKQTNKQPFFLVIPVPTVKLNLLGLSYLYNEGTQDLLISLHLGSVDPGATFFFNAQICKAYAMSRNKLILVSRVSFNSACVNSLN